MRCKITFRDVVISTIGSVLASGVVWAIGLAVSRVFGNGTEDSVSLADLLHSTVPLWVILATVTLLIFVLGFIRLFRRNPPFLKEHKMEAGGLVRSWQWKYDAATKRYLISELKTYCPVCGSVLTCELYARPPYRCINGHHYTAEQIGYTVVLDNIVDILRDRYPKYHDAIGHA